MKFNQEHNYGPPGTKSSNCGEKDSEGQLTFLSPESRSKSRLFVVVDVVDVVVIVVVVVAVVIIIIIIVVVVVDVLLHAVVVIVCGGDGVLFSDESKEGERSAALKKNK